MATINNHQKEIKVIKPTISKNGTLIFPNDVPEEVKDWINNG